MNLNLNAYDKILFPTLDTFLIRGPDLFKGYESTNEKKLMIIPKMYHDFIFRPNISKFKNWIPLESEPEELGQLILKNCEEHLKFIIDNEQNKAEEIRYSKVNHLDDNLDLVFLDIKGDHLLPLINNAEKFCQSKISPDKTHKINVHLEDSILEILTVSNKYKGTLILNGIKSKLPKYKNQDYHIADQFKVEVDSTLQKEIYQKIKSLIKVESITKNNEDVPEIDIYITPEDYKSVFGNFPHPNQFLILKEVDSNKVMHQAFRMKYSKRKLEKIDLEDLDRKVSAIWKPKSVLHIYQKLALDLLLDPEVKIVYLIGGKQTGKTSLAMAALEYNIFEIGIGRNNVKDPIENQITFIKSGLAKNIKGDQELLREYTSFKHTFSQQEFLIKFEEMLKSRHERDQMYRDKSTEIKKKGNLKDIVHLPDYAPFVLLGPGEEEGMSFTGYVIRDETQNEYPNVVRKFLERRSLDARIVVMGDLYDQINRPGLDQYWNGLLISLAENIHKPYTGGIVLTQKWCAG